MTIDDFKRLILNEDFEEILTKILLSNDAKHVGQSSSNYIQSKLAEKYNIQPIDIQLIIVGSAKIGFALAEKRMKDGTTLPRYRPFRPDSDIDIAIISPAIFEAIWNELGRFASSQLYLPWDSKKLGDYLVCGWLRPDYFPKGKRLRKCDDWYDTFRFLSSQQRLGRRQIRGGLFYNIEHLKTYQGKALSACIEFEKLQQ